MANNMNQNSTSDIPNQIDADNLYGLQSTNTGCLSGSCPQNTIATLGTYIPSLQEIAAYNLSAPNIGTINPNSMQQNQSYQSGNTSQPTQQNQNWQAPQNQMNMPMQNQNWQAWQNQMNMPTQSQQLTGNEQVLPSQVLPSTPATTLDYGATMGTTVREDLGMGITDFANPYPVTPESIQYLNGFIRTQIGRRVTIDFLVGSNTLVSRTGYLLGVATNYILINELDTNDLTTCDFYNIKFIRFYY